MMMMMMMMMMMTNNRQQQKGTLKTHPRYTLIRTTQTERLGLSAFRHQFQLVTPAK